MKEPIPIQISCATDDELLKMAKRESYTSYYKSLIAAEIKKREEHKSYGD